MRVDRNIDLPEQHFSIIKKTATTLYSKINVEHIHSASLSRDIISFIFHLD